MQRDADRTVPVEVALENWTLRPPQTCTITAQCGFLAVFVDPAGDDAGTADLLAASPFVGVPFAQVPNAVGTHLIRVELWNDDGTLAYDGDGGPPLRAEVIVEVRDPGGCTGGGDSGMLDPDASPGDAAPDDAGDAGIVDGGDATVDASSDGGQDGSVVDAPADGPMDASIESSSDGSMVDADPDASTEAGVDATPDVAPDVADDAVTVDATDGGTSDGSGDGSSDAASAG